MKVVLQALSVLLALGAGTAHAQLYKWVGPDGKITYSDTAPTHDAAKVETRPSASMAAAADLPYELAQAVRNHPVTLYTAQNCAPCDNGRKLLSERGIPFREKTVSSNEDLVQLRKAGGENLPLLTIGRMRERGFEASAWNNALTVAGYPATNRLPRTYRSPAPEPAAPRSDPEQAKQESTPDQQVETQPSATELPPAIGNAPPGFRF